MHCLRALLFATLAFLLVAAPPARAGGFVQTVIVDSIVDPVRMAFAPDGRIFVCEQAGRLRVIESGELLPEPFVTVPTVANDEEGLLGVALDPAFEDNGWVYVIYTARAATRWNRISRFTASGNIAVPGSETVIFELDDNWAHYHVGGAIRFGADGALYASTGDNGDGTRAQSLLTTHGKILRLWRDGSIPGDNPFYGTATGRHRAIWALGLRNAFSLDVQPGSGRVFVIDVGEFGWEEVNEAAAGGNYGWPHFEGPGGAPSFRDPIHAYSHANGCAITGAAFYDPTVPAFPAPFVGRFFYAEYCHNQIRSFDPANPGAFAVLVPTLVAGPVDIQIGPDGDLYYLARGNSASGGGFGTIGMLVRVSYEESLAADPRFLAESLTLGLPLPNPFRDHATLNFTLPRAGEVLLRVYDPRGREVARLVEGRREAGEHAVVWDQVDLPPGLYFANLNAVGRTVTRKLVRVQ